jgi:predicted kinase
MLVVIALMGLPGSGKTTLAERLAGARDWSIVSRDAIRAAMFRPCAFTGAEKQAAFQSLLLAVAACCKLGRSCIVEGMPFSRAREVEAVRGVAEAAGAQFLPVHLDCPLEVAQARVSRDTADKIRAPADRDAETVARVAARFAPPPADALRLDATGAPDDIVRALLAHLDTVPPDRGRR